MSDARAKGFAPRGRVAVVCAALWGATAGAAFDIAFVPQTTPSSLVANTILLALFFALPTGGFVGAASMTAGILIARLSRRVIGVDWVVSLLCALVVLGTSTGLVLLLLLNQMVLPGLAISVPLVACAVGSAAVCFVRIGAHSPWTWGGM